jgi:hypothetical protein
MMRFIFHPLPKESYRGRFLVDKVYFPPLRPPNEDLFGADFFLLRLFSTRPYPPKEAANAVGYPRENIHPLQEAETGICFISS